MNSNNDINNKDLKNKTMRYVKPADNVVNNNNMKDEFEIQDLSIDDINLEGKANLKVDPKSDIKLDSNSVNNSNANLNQNNVNNSQKDLNQDKNIDSNNKEAKQNSNESALGDNNENKEKLDNKEDNRSSISNNEPNEENLSENDNQDMGPKDDRSLKEKARDAKENLKDKADKIKNAPENIKNKINDTKDKINDTKEKIKNAPENIKNKVNDTKDKINNTKEKAQNAWNNRPRNREELKDKLKSGGSNLKERAKNGAKRAGQAAKQGAKKAGEKAKEGAIEGLKQTEIGQGIQKAKDTYNNVKTAVKVTKKVGSAVWNFLVATFPWLEIILGALILIMGIVMLVSIMMPGLFGDVNDSESYSEYSKTDQKTLEKLKGIFEDYPNADGALAMATVLYPYYDYLHDGNVSSYLTGSTDEDNVEDSEGEDLGEDDDNEDIARDEEDEGKEEDNYLIPFRNSKVRKRLKKVLKELENNDEEGFKNHLKTRYFKDDGGFTIGYDKEILTGYNGYKNLFKAQRNEDNRALLEDAIIEDLYEIKDLFINYVFQNAVCSANLIDAGTISTTELLKGNVLVDLKKPGCSSYKNCKDSYYDTYLTMEEYIKGVVYEEINDEMDINKIAAQMVAAKTYALSRRKAKVDSSTGAYVVEMLWSTADQDFCHTDKGCNEPDIKAYYGYETGGDNRLKHGANREAASDEKKAIYEQAWELTKDIYVVKEDGTPAATSYYIGSDCKPGTCMDQSKLLNYSNYDFKGILGYFYSDYSLATVVGDSTSVQTAGAKVCTNNTTNMTATRNKISAFAIDQVSKIPYDENGLATSKVYEENNFGTDVSYDGSTTVKKGLSSVGFVNFVYWNIVDNNFGNQNNIENIISDDVTYSITKEQLLIGDIGYSSDKSVIGIYIGNEDWIISDPVSGNVISTKSNDRITVYRRLNMFKDETYNYKIRTEKPTPIEWEGMKHYYWPSDRGECVWYAKNRAFEIIEELYANGSLTKKQYDKFTKRIMNSRGDGKQFYPDGSINKNGDFNGSKNIYDIKSASFFAKTPNHVLVIEYANRDEDKIIVTDGWNGEGTNEDNSCTRKSYSCLTFQSKTYTYDSFKKTYGSTFLGYLYFLED